MGIRGLLFVCVALMLVCGSAYAKKDKDHEKANSLPPGLQKNYDRGKPLPPGWQKKLSIGEIIDNEIYERGRVVVPLGKDGTISIEIEGTIIKLHENTREIINILSK